MEDFVEEEERSQNSFNFKLYLFKLATYYKWIICGMIIALLGGYLYLRYKVPSYEINGYILVGGGDLEGGSNGVLSNAGMINPADIALNTIDNEIFILKSHKIISAVVDSLDLDIDLSKDGKIKNQPVFKDSLPVKILVKKPFKSIDVPGPLYKLTLTDKNFKLNFSEKDFVGQYGKSFILDKDTVLISKKDTFAIHGKDEVYNFQIEGRRQTIRKYQGRLSVLQPKNTGIGLLRLSVIDEVPMRARSFIDVLIYSYNTSYLIYKNEAIKRALKFLTERLNSVSVELEKQENLVRDFKTSNKVFDVSATATELLSELQGADLQKSQNDYQLDLLKLVEASVKNHNGTEELVPNTAGLTDPVLLTQITSYNTLVQQKQTILTISTANDVRLPSINDQLKKLGENILKNVTNIRSQFTANKTFLYGQNNKFLNRFLSLPEKEKLYIELNRKLTVQETLYTYLLQKKEDTQLQFVTSDIVRSRTVDDTLTDGLVEPKPVLIYSFALGLGVLLPCLIIFAVVFFNDRIETRREVEDGTSTPILGELSLSDSLKPIVITSTNRTAIAEQFRSIRTNLSYIGTGTMKKVFVVTSSVSGEGKSFVSLNLANSMAIIGKKVVVLELDLRKPMLSRKIGINNEIGLSQYLVNNEIDPAKIIAPLVDYPNLYLISSGPIPPNPGELITSSRMEDLIKYLRANYDYVIMDSPPVGLVADAMALGRLADTSIFVIRHNYSHRSSLQLLNDLRSAKKLPNLALVINGIKNDKSSGYGYGSGGYGYGGYGYGYYSDDEEKVTGTVFTNIKNIFKSK
jgi:tyrosine-protein kinase Etk/Wzc